MLKSVSTNLCEGLTVTNQPLTVDSDRLTINIQKLYKLQSTADLAYVYFRDLTEWTNSDSHICMLVTDFKMDHESNGVYEEGSLEQTSKLSKSSNLIVDGQHVYLPKRHNFM